MRKEAPGKGQHDTEKNQAYRPGNPRPEQQAERVEHKEDTQQQPRAIGRIRPVDIFETVNPEQGEKVPLLAPHRAKNQEAVNKHHDCNEEVTQITPPGQ